MTSTAGYRRLRIGAVSYLNTKPLIYEFERHAQDAELVLDVPSCLADRLAQGDLDVALIPSIECFQHPSYTVISDACIACRGPVLSVKLLSRVPIQRIESLALDEGSRTSAALIQILLRRRYDLVPRLQPLPIGGRLEEVDADACLVIGDRAIHAAAADFANELDLGQAWCQWTGLPFVFAMWAARADVETGPMASALCRTRDAGVAHLAEIARAEAAGVGLDVSACLAYLRDNLYFTLGARERRGLEMFQRLAAAMGFAPLDCGIRNNSSPNSGLAV